MEIIIHRGTHQIGGCVTEIRTEETRIIIDLGTPLPGSKNENEFDVTKGNAIALPGVTVPVASEGGVAQPCDGVFITHYHGDHIGMIDTILPGIPLYLGAAAREIYGFCCKELEHTEKTEKLEHAMTYVPGQPVQIKDMMVTPLLTSHSALDAYMLLIEAEGKTVLHTGDFTLHSVEGHRWMEDIKALLQKRNITTIDYLICEGTMLPDQVRTSPTEQDVVGQISSLMQNYKKVFVLCSSTHIDRIAEFYHQRNNYSPMVSDLYQNTILRYVADTYRKTDDFYRLKYTYTYSTKNRKLKRLMDKFGFVALIRPNYWSKWMLEHYYDEKDSAIVYSMWSGYLKEGPAKNEYLCDFLKPYKITAFIHAGGHALPEEIKEFVDAVNPAHIIPIHTEYPDAMRELLPEREIVLLQDGNVLQI